MKPQLNNTDVKVLKMSRNDMEKALNVLEFFLVASIDSYSEIKDRELRAADILRSNDNYKYLANPILLRLIILEGDLLSNPDLNPNDAHELYMDPAAFKGLQFVCSFNFKDLLPDMPETLVKAFPSLLSEIESTRAILNRAHDRTLNTSDLLGQSAPKSDFMN
jgi:hypothetical protein